MKVLSLFDRTGAMVQPWLDAGHDCTIVDIQHEPGQHRYGLLTTWGFDLNEARDDLGGGFDMVFAFPPCTHLANSGARWFKDKGLQGLINGLTLVERARVICEQSGVPYMIENPVGQLSTYWRKPDMIFDPYEFAGWADDPDAEAYTKRTCLWVGGGFNPPVKRPVEAVLGSLFHRLPPSADRADRRSVTPSGFARAVFAANAPNPSGDMAALAAHIRGGSYEDAAEARGLVVIAEQQADRAKAVKR